MVLGNQIELSRVGVLSSAVVKSIDWTSIDAALQELGKGVRRNLQQDDEAQLSLDELRKGTDKLFETTIAVFDSKLSPLRSKISLAFWIVIPAASLATALGGFMVSTNSTFAYLISGGGLLIILSTIRYAWNLEKDHALLELFPHTYRILFSLCRTKEQYDSALESFKQELLQLRKKIVD